MNFKALLISGLCIALGSPISAENARQFWVLADVASVLSQPKHQAPISGCLPTGTAFTAGKKSGDWLYVDSVGGQAVRGWVHVSMVSETEVNEGFLLRGLSQSKTFADTLQWCERLVSLLPKNKAYMKALQKGYIVSGDTARAALYGRRIRGTEPIYLARYDGKDLLVIGAIDSTGEFRNLLWDETPKGENRRYAPLNDSSKAIKKKALGLRTSLATMEWYGEVNPDNRGEYFHSPKTVPTENERDGSDYISDVEGTTTCGISLGASADVYSRTHEKALFATRQFSAVPLKGITLPTEIDSLAWYKTQLVGKAFDSTGMAQINFANIGEYGYVDIAMSGIARYRDDRREQRGIFDHKRKRVWPPEYTGGIEYDRRLPYPKAVPRWIRFGTDASFPAFIVLPFSTVLPPEFNEEMGNFGYHLLRINRSGSKIFVVRSNYGGC
jgi:hypothetical protein